MRCNGALVLSIIFTKKFCEIARLFLSFVVFSLTFCPHSRGLRALSCHNGAPVAAQWWPRCCSIVPPLSCNGGPVAVQSGFRCVVFCFPFSLFWRAVLLKRLKISHLAKLAQNSKIRAKIKFAHRQANLSAVRVNFFRLARLSSCRGWHGPAPTFVQPYRSFFLFSATVPAPFLGLCFCTPKAQNDGFLHIFSQKNSRVERFFVFLHSESMFGVSIA